MNGVEHLGWFVLAGWLLNLTPGPDVLCIVNHGARSGFRAGVWATLGVTAGCFVHVLAAALGVGALMATSATAFAVLKWVGAAYLFWAGLKLLRAAPSDTSFVVANNIDQISGEGQKDAFFSGFLTNVLNPKVALFFLAFVPQFIAPDAAHPTLTFLALGVLFNLNALPVNFGYAALAALAARRLEALQRRMHWLDRVAGLMFIGFGLRRALTESPRT
jgi:threonine/homoserine/homoserine lactone efflux protein